MSKSTSSNFASILLKNEFIETICRLYLEKNDPEILRDILIWQDQRKNDLEDDLIDKDENPKTPRKV